MTARLGAHCLKHGSNVQRTISLSSGESEYYALVKGAAMGLSMQSMMKDWGIALAVKLLTDSSAAKGVTDRLGLGKLRHIQTRYLWLQERVHAKHLSVEKVPGQHNVADILTKSTSAEVLERHMKSLNQFRREGRSSEAKGLLSA